MVWPPRFSRRVRDGILALLGFSALGLVAVFALYRPGEPIVRLRMTAGQAEGTRHQIAEKLKEHAASRSIVIDLTKTEGSVAAIEALKLGTIDAALVQGGLNMDDDPALRQVAALHVEPLHVLVKAEIARSLGGNLARMRDKVVNLGERGSGTYLLAKEVMSFSGLRAGVEYVESTQGYADLSKETDRSRLPDVVFSVSTLPSPLARLLVHKHQYQLMPLTYREAFTLGSFDSQDISTIKSGRIDRRYVYDTTIPAFAYEIEPGVPPETIHTLGTRVLLIARKGIAVTTIRRLLDVVYNSPFSHVLQPPLDAKLLDLPPELPWHDGTLDYVRRNSPLIADDLIDQIEKELSILGVLVGGLFCIIQWLRRRYRRLREQTFEAYVLQVARIERQALVLAREPTLDLVSLLKLQEDLSQVKAEAIERFAEGELDGEELMSGFLVHASDARDFLMRMILHQRDNLEDQARAQRQPPEVLWKKAVGDLAPPTPPADITPQADDIRETKAGSDSMNPRIESPDPPSPT